MKHLALVVCVLAAVSAFGQGGVATAVPTITNTRGEPVPYAQVAVCGSNPGPLPLTVCNGNFAALYTDITLTTACQINVTPIAPISGTGCTNPGKSDGLANVVAFATPGQYWCEFSGGSITRPMVLPCVFPSGGGASLNCPAALNGSLGAFTSPTGFSCDPLMGTDFHGNGFAQSWRYLGPVNGFFSVIGGSVDPGTIPAYALGSNEARATAPATIPTSYYWHWPSTRCAIGQVWAVASQSTDGNGNPHDFYGCLTPGTGITFQHNGVNNSSQTLVNVQDTASCTWTNPSGGNLQVSCAGTTGSTQIATPSAPTLTPNGVTGATSITYKVVAVEDPYSVYHTAASASTTIANANATLSSSNSVTLSAYGDTLYGARCFDIYRTAAGGTPSSTGRIANCVGKKFTDTGLAGDSSAAPSTNNTTLVPHYGALPVANIPPNGVTGVDAPPASPTAFDDEDGETFGAPADVNNPFWSWCNQQSATASWSNGAIVLTMDTSGQIENLCYSLPGSTPYTFTAYLDSEAIAQGAACAIGFRESSTGKITMLELAQNNPADSPGASGGMLFQVIHATTYSTGLTGVHFWAYRGTGAYLRIQNTGSNIVYSYSDTNNGIAYQTLFSEAQTTPFTTTPNQLLIGGRASTTASVCTYDFERRTQ